MNAPFLPELRHDRRRAIEVEFLTERYHRAFDEEAALLAAFASFAGAGALVDALDKLGQLLAAHEQLQEQRMFPAYEHGASIDPALIEAWISDNASIADATADLRAACTSSAKASLCSRAIHFASEIERHLIDEVELLAAWAGRA